MPLRHHVPEPDQNQHQKNKQGEEFQSRLPFFGFQGLSARTGCRHRNMHGMLVTLVVKYRHIAATGGTAGGARHLFATLFLLLLGKLWRFFDQSLKTIHLLPQFFLLLNQRLLLVVKWRMGFSVSSCSPHNSWLIQIHCMKFYLP